MKDRYLTQTIEEICFPDHKMGLVSGPRQCGKTTLAKMLLEKRKAGSYYSWDEPVFRRNWVKNPGSLVPRAVGKRLPLLILDEIH
jgi:predicted AAA+ superfamily ATPase